MPRKLKILLVEDNLADAKLALRVFRDSGELHEIVHVTDGEKAVCYLRNSTHQAYETSPDLVVLDLNLPRRSGLDILKEIKASDGLKHIPVIILTSSDSEQDINDCFKAHANAYIKKSVDLYEFIETLKSFKKFWLQSSQLPRVV